VPPPSDATASDAASAPAAEAPPRRSITVTPPRPPRPQRQPPKPKLTQSALEGRSALRTFNELAAFFEAKQVPEPKAEEPKPESQETPEAPAAEAPKEKENEPAAPPA